MAIALEKSRQSSFQPHDSSRLAAHKALGQHQSKRFIRQPREHAIDLGGPQNASLESVFAIRLVFSPAHSSALDSVADSCSRWIVPAITEAEACASSAMTHNSGRSRESSGHRRFQSPMDCGSTARSPSVRFSGERRGWRNRSKRRRRRRRIDASGCSSFMSAKISFASRGPESRPTRFACEARASNRPVFGSIRKPNRSAKRIARKSLVGSSTKLRSCRTRRVLFLRSCCPPNGSRSSPSGPGSAGSPSH